MNKILVLLFIIGNLYGYNLPPKSDINKMNHEEKIRLYERNKINTIKAFFNHDVGLYSEDVLKIARIGNVISFTPFIVCLLLDKDNQEVVYFGMLTGYITIGLSINKVQAQKKVYNQNLYQYIFTSKLME
tara:strand:+ start:1514 stop:1903 length:390 start_codon:yes stop_codon:yes gene_type:complete